MGVVIRRYIDTLTIIINFPYSTCIRSFFWQQHPYFFLHFLNVFSVLKIRIRNRNGDFFTSRGAHVNCAIMAMLYTYFIGN